MATLQLKESEKYYFDEAAADKVCRFIEKFCRFFEGRFSGQAFILLDWERQTIRDLFGWRRRSDGLRRFRELYLLTAKGSGKTPLLAAIGLYMLLGDSEAAPHVISMASSFEQANLSFDCAKKYILEHPQLGKHAQIKQYMIKANRGHGKWTVASGKPTGRSGSRPNCIIASELHEWTGPTVESFNLLTSNLFKREAPLLLLDTNAAASRTGFAYQTHERAVRVLEGKSAETTLLPVIFEAPEAMDWTSEAAAAAANPSLGKIISWDQLQPQLAKARADESAEAEYRRLYLSQWKRDTGKKWLDLDQWDACTASVTPPKDAPLYVGIDLSQSDDLSAVVYVWPTSTTFFVQWHFWVPRCTAERYERQHAIPYTKWASEGAITLLDEPTIGPEVKRRIASYIVETSKASKVKAVCYDRYKSDEVIAALEAANLTCIPIAQGYSVSNGCQELDRRLKEGSISLEPNACARFCAENVEVTGDQRGNIWPVKPGAKSAKNAGKRWAKIDSVSALVTCLTEARKATFAHARKLSNARATII